MKVEIDIPGEGKRFIGALDPYNREFRKSVRASRHLFRKYDAWGIDADYFTDVLLPLNYNIRIVDEESGTIYRTDAETWKKKGKHFHFKESGKDHRAQIFLSRRHFETLQIPNN